MGRLLRHLLAIAVLPFTVAVLVPLWIARQNSLVPVLGSSSGRIGLQVLGVAVLGLGLLLFVSSVRRFAREGEGTLAPWDPPRKLVARGPYRHVRNPMITGVVGILLAEAAITAAAPLLLWAVAFFAVVAVFIRGWEEPHLKKRYGDEYVEYRRNVPAWIPQLLAWNPSR
jgi:protein-S-isoprenylcysteine O-methyltransferase Ste14